MEIDAKVLDVFNDPNGKLLILEREHDSKDKFSPGTEIVFKGERKKVKELVEGTKNRIGLLVA